MLQFVHHVHYLVRDRDAMVEYMEKNFGMKPDILEVNHHGKDARYNVGKTQIQFTEPADPASGMGEHLAKHGPGVFHVAWGVNNIKEVARDLHAKGNRIKGRGEDGKELATKNVDGVMICNLDPATSHGLWFQLAEG